MITSGQLRAARALLNLDRKTLAQLAGLSLPTIQRMESAEDVVGGNVEPLLKVVEALEQAGHRAVDEPSMSVCGSCHDRRLILTVADGHSSPFV